MQKCNTRNHMTATRAAIIPTSIYRAVVWSFWHLHRQSSTETQLPETQSPPDPSNQSLKKNSAGRFFLIHPNNLTNYQNGLLYQLPLHQALHQLCLRHQVVLLRTLQVRVLPVHQGLRVREEPRLQVWDLQVRGSLQVLSPLIYSIDFPLRSTVFVE